jgi:ubiquinone/menaquinone biosynthesis C-methylase UbiE
MAQEIDQYWQDCAIELAIHTIEACGCLQSCNIGDTVLEAGCGTGHIYKILQKSNIGKYTGLDSSLAMLEVFKGHHPDVDTVHGDVRTLPFADSSFDVVICLEVLRHMPAYDQAIRELYRVAKKAAVFTLEVTHGTSKAKGENRNRSYLTDIKEPYVHYQIEYNVAEVLAWLESEFNCPIDIKIIGSNKWMFVLNKQIVGLKWGIVPLPGMEEFVTTIYNSMADMALQVKTTLGHEIKLLVMAQVKSVTPLEVEFKSKTVVS